MFHANLSDIDSEYSNAQMQLLVRELEKVYANDCKSSSKIYVHENKLFIPHYDWNKKKDDYISYSIDKIQKVYLEQLNWSIVIQFNSGETRTFLMKNNTFHNVRFFGISYFLWLG